MQDLGDSHEWLMFSAHAELTGSPYFPARREGRKRYHGVSAEMMALANPVRAETVAVSSKAVSRKRKPPSWQSVFQPRYSLWVRGQEDVEMGRILGYSSAEARAHLERQFRNGMSWKNYAGYALAKRPRGRGRVWHIDHIVPKSLFEEADVAAAYALTNLRPLWAADNMRKAWRRTHLL